MCVVICNMWALWSTSGETDHHDSLLNLGRSDEGPSVSAVLHELVELILYRFMITVLAGLMLAKQITMSICLTLDEVTRDAQYFRFTGLLAFLRNTLSMIIEAMLIH